MEFPDFGEDQPRSSGLREQLRLRADRTGAVTRRLRVDLAAGTAATALRCRSGGVKECGGMRLVDLDENRSIKSVGLVLTPAEASELKDGLDQMLAERAEFHVHVSSSDFQTELTISLEAE